MKIDHIALYTNDLERLRTFYCTYFHATSNDGYHNAKTGLRTYFLSFEDETRLEIMTRPGLASSQASTECPGYTHLAFRTQSRASVDLLTDTLRKADYTVMSRPRVTSDGYYESCVLDPDGNRIEITA
jgi:lactoylglutathione lyase